MAALIIAMPVTIIHAAGNEITIKGSTTVLPVAQAAAEVFMEKNPGINISVQGGGSGVGIASLLGQDHGHSHLIPQDQSLKKSKRQRPQGSFPMKSPSPLTALRLSCTRPIQSKPLPRPRSRISTQVRSSIWSELGGKNAKIVVVNRDTSSGTYEAFELLALNKEKVRPDALTTASNQAVAQTVAQTPGAIGYIGHGYLTPKVKAVTVDKIECTKQTIQSEKYPLSRYLYVYTNGKPTGNVQKFIRLPPEQATERVTVKDLSRWKKGFCPFLEHH